MTGDLNARAVMTTLPHNIVRLEWQIQQHA